MLDYNSWQEAQAKVEPLRKQVMEAILKDERFNASIPDAYRDNLLRVDIKNKPKLKKQSFKRKKKMTSKQKNQT